MWTFWYFYLLISTFIRPVIVWQEIDESAIEAEVKSSVKAAVDSYAVSLLTRLRRVDSDATITCANIHVAYDRFLRQDKQCLQVRSD